MMINPNDASSFAGRTPKFVVEVLYNFFPSDKQHLTLTQYEKVKVIETHESNWWIGERANGEVGLFPANYVRRVEEQLQKRKQIASQLGLGGLDLDDLLSEDDDDDDILMSSEDEQENPNTTLTKQSSTASLKTQPPLPSQQQQVTTGNMQNATGKFVTEEAYEKKKRKELQEALQKQLEDQKTKTRQAEEIQKLKEELSKAKAEVEEARKVTTPRTTPRGANAVGSQSIDLEKKQKSSSETLKKEKELEKEYEKKQRESEQELEKKKKEMEKELEKQAEKKAKESEKQNSANSEMQKQSKN
ncbi:hypothetical protein FDP41_009454 [Naegleria fowleri]|uniref:SH3 domain-containing protein n=1 Tax=Naegleria fowleri TaxID=5763 RepID=A0A6A5BDV7_NAEFO|nr:uncharacterized protein FDP41_009454 [Naegleria fowleri]KAF0972250.1 hypothetical protein FDP41_009454 [Naegleria fowleri]